jgi:regulator of protease activity HflC (stomatin/prohibitin superfamily)
MLIKDLTFSQELQESLSAAAQAQRVGRSKIIAAKAEVQSAALMREASDVLSSDVALSIRYLDTMASLAKGSNTRVIFLPSSHASSDQVNPLLYANLSS